MNIYIDCEFNGYLGELISMALVTGTGLEWYEVLECQEPRPWVKEHVIPVLNKAPVSKKYMLESLGAFLNQFPRIHLISDWPEDIKYFCEMLVFPGGLRIKTPPLTMEINGDLNSNLSKIPHNALSDAYAICFMHQPNNLAANF